MILQIFLLIGLIFYRPNTEMHDIRERISPVELAAIILVGMLASIFLFQRTFIQRVRYAPSIRSYFVLLFRYCMMFKVLVIIVGIVGIFLSLLLPSDLSESLIWLVVIICSAIWGASTLPEGNIVISLVWLAISASIAACLFITEFILRKILEQSGGVIAGIAALLGILAGFLKLIS
jgi:hypothetical protein